MDTPLVMSESDVSPVTPEWLNEAESERLVASMEYWYPRLLEVDGLNVPATAFVSLEPAKIHEGTIHEYFWAEFDNAELREAITRVGGVPAFLRTDQASNIYEMSESKVESLSTKELEVCANGVIGFSAQGAEVPFCSLVVREWLDIEHRFTSWGGKKVGVEVRFFVSGGEVEGWCFDWPADNLQPDTEGWEDAYAETEQIAREAVERAIPMAERVAERFESAGDGAWSVDFVLTEQGDWYCTDMAPKRMSQVAGEIHTV